MKPMRYLKSSSMGYEHVRVSSNCQDSLALIQTSDFVVGFVVDGVGDPVDSPYSEVGSRMVSQVAAHYVEERLHATLKWRRRALVESQRFWMEVQNKILSTIHQTALMMGGSYKRMIVSHFMFTITGFVTLPELTVFVGVGDGYFGVNDLVYKVAESAPENMPASLTYHLVESALRKMSPEEITLKVLYQQPTSEIQKYLVCTDGLRFFLQNIPIEGIYELKPEFKFWDEISYFENEYSLGWKLNELSSEKRTIDWEAERVRVQKPVALDDVALIVGSRI